MKVIEERRHTKGFQTDRNHYAIAGQLIAVQVKPKDQAGVFYYQFNDRQGSVAAMRRADGTWVNNNRAHYTAYGSYAVKPGANVNPGISDRGYTGHRHNNTGTYDLGLIYMNARYYLPEVGRFISPDTIVPEPGNPQSSNRYSYVLNSPVNYTDPSGHCAGNANGTGNSYDENLCWASVHTIGNLWDDTDYWQQQWGSYEDFFANVGSHPLLGTDFFADELMRYFQSDQYKAWSKQLPAHEPPPPLDIGDYWVISGTSPLPLPFFVGAKLIRDDWGRWYVNIHQASAPGISLMRGEIYVNENSNPSDAKHLAEFPIDLQADLAQSTLPGISGGANAGYFAGGGINIAAGNNAHVYVEGGFYRPGFAAEFGYTFILPWTR